MQKTWLPNLLELIFPNLCLACHDHLQAHEEIMCLSCAYKTPQTNFHLDRDNEFTQHFWGRINIYTGAALFKFTKGGRAQELLYALKYKNKPIVGNKLGEFYGHQLKKSPFYSNIDAIIPVPLHPRKKHQRGYNQSDKFANGLSASMQIPVFKNILQRKLYTDTQTKKSRIERVNNVENAFSLTNTTILRNKHILLVDDVITTGATLEACGNKLLTVDGLKLSMVTIAIAR